jgi:hypothetical protein
MGNFGAPDGIEVTAVMLVVTWFALVAYFGYQQKYHQLLPA